MMIEVPESIRNDYEKIKKHSIEHSLKNYFNSHLPPKDICFDTVVLADMMALYIVYHDIRD